MFEGTTATEWINAIAAIIGALAVVVGLFGANRKINEAQTSARLLRRSQIAEDLIALAHNADDALRNVRSSFGSIPREEVSNKLYLYQQRHDKLIDRNSLFARLREAQIRARAVIGDDDVEAAVEKFFRVRHRVSIANSMLADMINDDDDDQETRELKRKLSSELHTKHDDQDELTQEIVSALNTIEQKLSPIARLESN